MPAVPIHSIGHPPSKRMPAYRALYKPLLFVLGLTPFLWLIWRLVTNNLGANPVETLTHTTGNWGLNFLLITLLITPLRRLTGQNDLIQFRRMLGLFAFFYTCLHFTIFSVFDHALDLAEMWADVVKRPYITVGSLGFSLMIPLAITSNQLAIKTLGRRWGRLHRLTYVCAIAGVVHYAWLVKADLYWPLMYGFVLSILLGYRLFNAVGK